MQLLINAGIFSAWKKTVFSLPARSYIRPRCRFLNTWLHGQHHSVLRGMCFIDAARPDPMVLLWIWRMIYVTQNNKTVPNSQKNAPVICLNCSSLLGRLCRPTNTFNPNALWNLFTSCLCSGSTFFFFSPSVSPPRPPFPWTYHWTGGFPLVLILGNVYIHKRSLWVLFPKIKPLHSTPFMRHEKNFWTFATCSSGLQNVLNKYLI